MCTNILLLCSDDDSLLMLVFLIILQDLNFPDERERDGEFDFYFINIIESHGEFFPYSCASRCLELHHF